MKLMNVIIFLLFLFPFLIIPQENYSINDTNKNIKSRVLEDFENIDEWKIIKAGGAEINLQQVKGKNGKAIEIKYNYPLGTGYCGIQKEYEIDLTQNFKISFYLKANSYNNNLEFKMLDKSGENVWWVKKWNFKFPEKWKKIVIKRDDIEFAWGPTANESLGKIGKLEFTISASSGKGGTILIDSLTYEPLSDDLSEIKRPEIYVENMETKSESFNFLIDSDMNEADEIILKQGAKIEFDFLKLTEIGGLSIAWGENICRNYEIFAKSKNENFKKIFSKNESNGGMDFINFSPLDLQYLEIRFMPKKNEEIVSIKEITFFPLDFTQDPNVMFAEIAKHYERGLFPRYKYDEGSYWTTTGVKNDKREALINEEGMIEVDKKHFSIEPFLFHNNKLLTWNESTNAQTLMNEYLPIPSVNRKYDDFNLEITAFSSGKADVSSELLCKYVLTNTSELPLTTDLYLSIRPFQVYPNYMTLFFSGGVAPITNISFHGKIIEVDNKTIYLSKEPSEFGATKFRDGEIVTFLKNGILPKAQSITDEYDFASGAAKYEISLLPNESITIYAAIPYHSTMSNFGEYSEKEFNELKDITAMEWENLLNNADFSFPANEKLLNIVKSNIAYIFINSDGPGTQPGSRCYERSWIRDGAFTIALLLKLGFFEDAKRYIEWYSNYQYESGKIPCVVDTRGPDPVEEHDSNGQYLFLLKTYLDLTKDTLLIKQHLGNIKKAVSWLEYLIEQRSTDYYKSNDSLIAYYGILPESISHEGYTPAMHSYWDSFFAYRGLKDAAELVGALGKIELKNRYKEMANTFTINLVNSIKKSIEKENIDFIPGCVELGDFDPTSTAISIYPTFVYKHLPEVEFNNTFNKYYDFFVDRYNGKIDWKDYTPYETRLIGTFLMLGKEAKAYKMLDFFLNDQRPKGWNHWAEVVHKCYREPKFIGDMPHTWVGAEFINSVLTIFAYENHADSIIYIGSGIVETQMPKDEKISISNYYTSSGEVSFEVIKNDNKIIYTFIEKTKAPANGFKINNPFPNGAFFEINNSRKFTTEKYISLKELPEAITFEK